MHVSGNKIFENKIVIWLIASLTQLLGCTANAHKAVPLKLEATIPLINVAGRIDHMDIDLARKRLFVAELGNEW